MLQIDTDQMLNLSIEDIIGQRIAVLGISGSGKTTTVATFAEELLPHLAMTIIDVEGEYYGLKEKYTLLVAGRSEHAEVPLFVENAPAIAEMSIRRGISVILDLSEYDQEEMQSILLAYFEQLWKLSTSLKSPYEVVIEEAHEFIPQGQRTPLKTLLTRFALRGRKRGVGVILASQRSAKVEKDLLTQASILFLHSVVHPTDLNVYKDLVPLPTKEVEQARELIPGEAFVVRGKYVDRVHVRRRHTFHAGATPELNTAQPHLKTIDATLLEELREITKRSMKEGGSDEVAKLKKRLRDTETLLTQRDAEVAELKKRLELVSTLRVEMPDQVVTMPDTMHIERATVGQIHTPVPAIAHVVESAPVARELAGSSVPLNEGRLKALQTWFERKTTPHQRRMLRVLHEQGKSMDAYEISSWSGYAESMIRKQPPLELVRRGILSRAMAHKGYQYTSTLKEFLAREFPGTDQQVLIRRVLSWCH